MITTINAIFVSLTVILILCVPALLVWTYKHDLAMDRMKGIAR